MTDLFMAGFDCSSQVRRDGVRLDLVAATGHDLHALSDYRQCAALGVSHFRDGLRWHLIEPKRGQYDWSSWAPMVEAAATAGVQVYWDLFHYGLPIWAKPLSDDFPAVFADYALAAAHEHVRLTGRPLDFCAMNEISYLCWAAKMGHFTVTGYKHGAPLKAALARAAIAACRAIHDAGVGGEHIWAEPLIRVAPLGLTDEAVEAAKHVHEWQYEAFDMIAGRLCPELGGHPDLLGTIGVNIYPTGQWYLEGSIIPLGHHDHREIGDMLVSLWQRYERPIVISETGCEGRGRPAWLHYVCDEVRAAMAQGVPIRGICLYPIAAYPGWDDGRMAHAGLLGAPDEAGVREVYEPLAQEIARQSALF